MRPMGIRWLVVWDFLLIRRAIVPTSGNNYPNPTHAYARIRGRILAGTGSILFIITVEPHSLHGRPKLTDIRLVTGMMSADEAIPEQW